MTNQSGIALVSALLLLAFLSLVGGALLTTAAIDLKIVDNYKISTQLLFIAEAGIEDARERLRTSPVDLSTDLGVAAGADGIPATSRDLATLLAGDDRPFLPASPALRSEGVVLGAGPAAGAYHIFLRNDTGDGRASTEDTNGVVALLAIARIGDRKRVIEVEVGRGAFPALPSALTLDGPAAGLDLAGSELHIDGRDRCAGVPKHAIGVVSDADAALVAGGIEGGTEDRYTGVDPFPDVANVDAGLSGQLKRPETIERIVASFRRHAEDIHTPDLGTAVVVGSTGAPDDPRIVVVDGDAELGPGDGHGVLLVRGTLTLRGRFTWRGLILVIGQGEVRWNGADGEINGGVFLAKTRGLRSLENPLGDLLDQRGDIVADFGGAGGNGISYDSCALKSAAGELAYMPISIREY